MVLSVNKVSAIIEKEISKMKFDKNNVESLYEPISYILKLGGKRLRPVMCIYSYALFLDSIEKAIKPALALEIFHNFTLMHDDLMDNAPLRRGKVTVHENWNANTAILSGDAMLIKAYEYLGCTNDKILLDKITQRFNKTALEVCEGQMLDMQFETKTDLSIAEYIEMIRLKTSVLLGFSLELGALLADADEATAHKLFDVGVNAGIGFQIKDDYLDLYADTKTFGKQKGGDIIANKKTYLLVKFLELASENDKKKAKEWFAKSDYIPEEKITFFTQMFESYKIPELAKAEMQKYFDTSVKLLDSTNANLFRKGRLKSLLKTLIERDK